MQSLTVASFNIHWGRHPRSYEPFDVLDACRRLDADVLALQEVWRPDGETSVAEEVADARLRDPRDVDRPSGRGAEVPHRRAHRRPGRYRRLGPGAADALPRGPVTEHRLDGFLFDPNDRAVMTTDIEIDGGTLTVRVPLPASRAHLAAAALAPARRAAGRASTRRAHGRLQHVAVGGPLHRAGLARHRARPTWPSRRPVFQIDHLLATPPVVATDAEVVRAGESDHLPIRARVSLRR